jgi:hypothetical protein
MRSCVARFERAISLRFSTSSVVARIDWWTSAPSRHPNRQHDRVNRDTSPVNVEQESEAFFAVVREVRDEHSIHVAINDVFAEHGFRLLTPAFRAVATATTPHTTPRPPTAPRTRKNRCRGNHKRNHSR